MAYIITSKTKAKSIRCFNQIKSVMEYRANTNSFLPDCCYSGNMATTDNEKSQIDESIKFRNKCEKEYSDLKNYLKDSNGKI